MSARFDIFNIYLNWHHVLRERGGYIVQLNFDVFLEIPDQSVEQFNMDPVCSYLHSKDNQRECYMLWNYFLCVAE